MSQSCLKSNRKDHLKGWGLIYIHLFIYFITLNHTYTLSIHSLKNSLYYLFHDESCYLSCYNCEWHVGGLLNIYKYCGVWWWQYQDDFDKGSTSKYARKHQQQVHKYISPPPSSSTACLGEENLLVNTHKFYSGKYIK